MKKTFKRSLWTKSAQLTTLRLLVLQLENCSGLSQRDKMSFSCLESRGICSKLGTSWMTSQLFPLEYKHMLIITFYVSLPILSAHRYGTTGCPVKRDVIRLKDGLSLDLNPPVVSVCRVVPANSPHLPATAKQLQTSSAWTIKQLKEHMAELLASDTQASARIWLLEDSTESSQNTPSGMVTPDKLEHASLEPAGDDEIIRYSSITDEATLALEIANEDGTWLVNNHSTQPEQPAAAPAKKSIFGGVSFIDGLASKTQAKRAALTTTSLNGHDKQPVASTSNLSAQPMRMTRSQTSSSGSKKGLVGLTNLGNTCFVGQS